MWIFTTETTKVWTDEQYAEYRKRADEAWGGLFNFYDISYDSDKIKTVIAKKQESKVEADDGKA